MEKVCNLLKNIPTISNEEIFETLAKTENITIERIISYGQITSQEYWYDQQEDEFVMVVKGRAIIKYDDGSIYKLNENDSLYIQAHQKHQVIYTSNPTIWLAVFIKK